MNVSSISEKYTAHENSICAINMRKYTVLKLFLTSKPEVFTVQISAVTFKLGFESVPN